MDMVRQVIVFDAADLRSESAFWAGILGGHVFEDDGWHSVIDAAGSGGSACSSPRTMFRPTGRTAHPSKCISTSTSRTLELRTTGDRPRRPTAPASSDLDTGEGHQVYADPAGHPFCVGWGQPSRERVAAIVARRFGQAEPGQGAPD